MLITFTFHFSAWLACPKVSSGLPWSFGSGKNLQWTCRVPYRMLSPLHPPFRSTHTENKSCTLCYSPQDQFGPTPTHQRQNKLFLSWQPSLLPKWQNHWLVSFVSPGTCFYYHEILLTDSLFYYQSAYVSVLKWHILKFDSLSQWILNNPI